MLTGAIITNLIFLPVSVIYLKEFNFVSAAMYSAVVVLVIAFIITLIANLLVIKNPSKGNVTFGYIAGFIGFAFLNKIGPLIMIVAFSQINKARKLAQTQQETAVENVATETNETNVFEL